MTAPGLGVMMFSLSGLLWRRELDLSAALRTVASLGPDQGIELIGAQSFPSYPRITADDIRSFRELIDAVGVVPVGYCAYLEQSRSQHAQLSPHDAAGLFEEEVATARALGFPMVRINAATPSILTTLAAMAERHGVDIVVEIGSEPRSSPAVADLLSELNRIGCSRLGLIQDFSAFVTRVPPAFISDAVLDGIPAGAVSLIVQCWDQQLPLDDALSGVRNLAGLTEEQRGRAHGLAHITYGLFRRGDARGLLDVLPQLKHVQAKFFELDEDDNEPCIPYPELIASLRDGGYTGRLHSEFEGFLWSDDLDALDQIGRQQRNLVKLWGGANGPSDPTATEPG